MKTEKKKIIVIVVVALFVISAFVLRLILKMQSEKIPDTNGESKEICTMDDEFIESYFDYYSLIKHSVKRDTSVKSGIKGDYEETDCGYLKESFGSLSGIYICNSYLASSDSVKYMVNSAVNSGNLRIVVTNGNNQILYDVPIDTTHQFEIETTVGKTYYLKLIGESANVEVTVFRSE